VPGPGVTELVASVQALSEVAEIKVLAPLQRPGVSLSPAHLVDAAQRTGNALSRGCDGAVVVHGTDAMEKSAFIVDPLVGGPRPVVVTGVAGGTGDGPGPGRLANLVAATRAAWREALDLGTLVVMDDAIHTARFVQKVRTGPVAAFVSPLVGPIGSIIEGRPRFWARVPRLPVLASYGVPPRPVALLRWTMADDGRRLGRLPMLGYAGAVFEGMSAGHVPMEAVPLLGKLAARSPVVLALRCEIGAVFTRTPDMTAATGPLRRGLIPAGYLSGLKAKLLLRFALRGDAGHAAAAVASAVPVKRGAPSR
jgi:L-asparaginase